VPKEPAVESLMVESNSCCYYDYCYAESYDSQVEIEIVWTS
jgi:hypothetical protein